MSTSTETRQSKSSAPLAREHAGTARHERKYAISAAISPQTIPTSGPRDARPASAVRASVLVSSPIPAALRESESCPRLVYWPHNPASRSSWRAPVWYASSNLIERSRGEFRCYGVKLQLDNGAEIRCFYGERRPDDVEVSVTPSA